MKIDITPETPGHTSMDVDDSEIVGVYKAGGMEAVRNLLIAEADAMPEQPFYFPEMPSEDEILELLEES